MKEFETAHGSILGRVHRDTGKNNQDAFALIEREDYIIAIVCDGCSDCVNSGVGAALGARLLAHSIERQLVKNGCALDDPNKILKIASNDMLAHLRVLTLNVAGFDSFRKAVEDYMLFTIVGYIVTRERTIIFSAGDGSYCLNGNHHELGPFPDNAPPYIGYALFDGSSAQVINESVATRSVDSLLIATDGIGYIARIADNPLPGKSENVGPLSQFWENNAFFQNPDAVRRRLTLMNRDYVAIRDGSLEKTVGLLQDDATLIAMRRKQE